MRRLLAVPIAALRPAVVIATCKIEVDPSPGPWLTSSPIGTWRMRRWARIRPWRTRPPHRSVPWVAWSPGRAVPRRRSPARACGRRSKPVAADRAQSSQPTRRLPFFARLHMSSDVFDGSLNQYYRDLTITAPRDVLRVRPGVCDRDCRDIDLRLYSPDGNRRSFDLPHRRLSPA